MGFVTFLSNHKEKLIGAAKVTVAYTAGVTTAIAMKTVETAIQASLDTQPWLQAAGIIPIAAINAVSVGGVAATAYYFIEAVEWVVAKGCNKGSTSNWSYYNPIGGDTSTHTQNNDEHLIDDSNENTNFTTVNNSDPEDNSQSSSLLKIENERSKPSTKLKTALQLGVGSAAVFSTSVLLKAADATIHAFTEDKEVVDGVALVEGGINGLALVTAGMVAFKFSGFIEDKLHCSSRVYNYCISPVPN